MSWASRRKAVYTSGAGGFLLLAGLLVFFLFIYQSPSCSDGKQNGGELGIDCGGGCQKVCAAEAEAPVVLWARSFEVVPGVYNVVAYVENPNVGAGVAAVPYRFKIFEEGNILITERMGATYLLPHRTSIIVEPSLNVGERRPTRTQFEFLAAPQWKKVADRDVPALFVQESTLLNAETAPKITATVINNSNKDLKNVEAVAVVFNAEDNAIAVSRTLIELPRAERKTIVFTWPKPFPEAVSRIDVQARAPF